MSFRILTLLVITALVSAPPAAAKGILILHGEATATPWTNGVTAGVKEEAGKATEVHREFLGQAAADEEQIHAFAMALQQRLSSQVRAVIATDRTAVAFVGKYRDELFPQSAVVLTGPERIDPGRLPLYGDCAALPLAINLKNTVDLIFTLRPETRLVAGIIDGTPASKIARTALEQAMRPYTKKAELIFPGHEPGDEEGLELDTLGQVLAEMPGRGVAVLLRFQKDNAGNPVPNEQLYRVLKKHIASPVFVLTDATLGSGVVGGVLVTGKDTGRIAVRLARRIMAGEPTREMLPEPVPARTVLDGAVLARFGMAQPEGATVVNAPGPPDASDEIVSGFGPTAAAGMAVFAVLVFLLQRYRQKA